MKCACVCRVSSVDFLCGQKTDTSTAGRPLFGKLLTPNLNNSAINRECRRAQASSRLSRRDLAVSRESDEKEEGEEETKIISPETPYHT